MLEKYNWSGILVEADKNNYEKLINNRKKATNVHCALYSSDNLDINFYTGISNGLGSIYCQETTTKILQTVKTKTMTSILIENNAPKTLDYISLDLEGAEYDALLGFDFSMFSARLWTIEHNNNKNLKDKIIEIMQKHGYKLSTECPTDIEEWFYV
jgi:FkbM family methyltransferase